MTLLARWYPGDLAMHFCVIVAATVSLVSASAWFVSLFFERHPAVRHSLLLSALVASISSPLFASAFVGSGKSFIAVPVLAATDTPILEPADAANTIPFDTENRFDENGTVQIGKDLLTDRRDAVEIAVTTVTRRNDAFRSMVVAVMAVWLCGTLVAIVRLLLGGLFLRRIRRSLQSLSETSVRSLHDEAGRLLRA